jgi:hypothetical protein
MAHWNIIFSQGATYQQDITLTGVSDIASATEWRVRCAMPSEAPFLVATTANGMLVPTANANRKTLSVPAALTADMPLGNGRFDFEVEWAGGIVRRYYPNGSLQVVPQVGEGGA